MLLLSLCFRLVRQIYRVVTNNPYFKLFPLNNARTGYKPYAMPIIYIERNRLSPDGLAIGDSATQKIRYYIVNAPDQSKVAGPFNTNLRVPNFALYEVDLTEQQLLEKKIQVSNFQFYSKSIDSSGNIVYTAKDFSDVVDGDYFDYTLSYNNVTDKVEYYSDAYYYDLSDIEISVDNLPKPKRYYFVWEATFFNRISTSNGNMKCIGAEPGMVNSILEVNHPGEVHNLIVKSTPSLYFNYEGFKETTDPTIEFYRPFADLLQDIFDEQELLDGINRIDTIPVAFIPYLAYLIGWDLPNYPGVSDNLRRQILKRAVHLQKLKGSKRVINELFEMFGFTIDIVNLWADKNGDKLLGMNDGLSSELTVQVDQLVSNYDGSGYSVGNIPITFVPDKNVQVSIYAYQVKIGSEDYTKLINFSNNLSSNLEYYNDNIVRYDINNNIITESINNLNHSFTKGLINSNNILINGDTYSLTGRNIISSTNVSYDKNKNIIFLNFDHELSVDGGKIFVFAIYQRTKIVIPSDIKNTRSSKFDVQILNKNDSPVDYNLLIYLLSFIFKLKSFHSLLRKIKQDSNTYEVYNVTDFCLSVTDTLKPNTDLGDLQVPPAIIPTEDNNCVDTQRGFKQTDINLKNIVYNGLEEEFNSWKNQRTKDANGNIIGDNCSLTPEGQDRVLPTTTDFDQNIDNRQTYCEDSKLKPDFCYKGRVIEELSINNETILEESYNNVPCSLKLGNGTYWEEYSKTELNKQKNCFLSSRLKFVKNDLKTLHYSAYPYFKLDNSQNTLALNPASLNIEKEHLGFPSHRFLSLAYLYNDYNYTQDNISLGYDLVRKRPWDIDRICGIYNNELNAVLSNIEGIQVRIYYDGSTYNIYDLITGLLIKSGLISYSDAETYVYSNGLFVQQTISWDNSDLVLTGNKIESEMNLNDHTITTGDDRLITHNIYQNTTINPYVQDDFTITSSSKISTSGNFGEIFSSACNNEDFIDGYPSEYNTIPISWNYRYDSPDLSGFIDRSAIASGIGLGLGTLQTSARFFGKSMIFVDKSNTIEYNRVVPYRLDCSCKVSSCDPSDVTSLSLSYCDDDPLFDSSGNLDPSPDKIEFDFAAVLIENISTCTRLSNHEIENLFCLNSGCSLPSTGSFKYKDDYDIIYEVSWVVVEGITDIITVTKDPRIPGIDSSGYVKDGAVYRKGVITTIRQIIVNNIVEAEGTEQIVGYYQSNLKCGDVRFENPFAYGIDCAFQDNVEVFVSNGPRWIDPSTIGSGVGSVWSDPSITGTGSDDSLIWIDFVTP